MKRYAAVKKTPPRGYVSNPGYTKAEWEKCLIGWGIFLKIYYLSRVCTFSI